VIVAALLAALAVGTADVSVLRTQLPAIHPDPWHEVAKASWEAQADALAAQPTVVGFMRLVASLGPRNGHTGIFPLDPGNRRAFHELPLLPYEFSDGVFVVGQLGGQDLVGARIDAVGGIPVAQVLERLRPLVPADNASSLRARRPQYLMSAEVLAGLGIDPQLTLRLRDGSTVERTLAPVAAAAYSRAFDIFRFRMFPLGAAHVPDRAAPTRVSTLAGGRVVYFAYNSTYEYVGDDAARIRRLALRPRAKRIVVDLRNNTGGDNHTYPVLVDTLRALARQHREIVVLGGRVTFSAAVNFLADLESATRFLLVGEDSGGSPNLFGDAQPLDLPETGLRAEVATVWWVKSRRGERDPRLTFHPDVVVEPASAPYFAGRDPALAAALSAPFAKARAVH
jgi:hypothetical protein